MSMPPQTGQRQTVTTFCVVVFTLLFTTPVAVTAQENNVKLYAQVVRAEMKAGELGQRNSICLALPHYSDPSRSLLKALQSEGVLVQKPAKCMFRGYQIRLEQVTPHSIRTLLVDVRYKDTDLGITLRDGVYSIEKDAAGEWNIRDYKPVQPSDRK